MILWFQVTGETGLMVTVRILEPQLKYFVYLIFFFFFNLLACQGFEVLITVLVEIRHRITVSFANINDSCL